MNPTFCAANGEAVNVNLDDAPTVKSQLVNGEAALNPDDTGGVYPVAKRVLLIEDEITIAEVFSVMMRLPPPELCRYPSSRE